MGFDIPAQPAVMVLGGSATLVGLVLPPLGQVLPPLGQVLAWVAWPFLEWTIRVVEATARLPLLTSNNL